MMKIYRKPQRIFHCGFLYSVRKNYVNLLIFPLVNMPGMM